MTIKSADDLMALCERSPGFIGFLAALDSATAKDLTPTEQDDINLEYLRERNSQGFPEQAAWESATELIQRYAKAIEAKRMLKVYAEAYPTD